MSLKKKYLKFKRKLLHNLTRRLVLSFGAKIVSLWFSTCKIKIIGETFHQKYVLGSNKMIGVSWHRNAIFMVWFFRHIHPMVMISQSRDGELIAGVAEKLGMIPVRGSSNKGGTTALHKMAKYLRRPGNLNAATVLDGPLGPPFIAKRGMLVLSKLTGVPLLPIMMSASPALTLHKTWDKTLLPLPFSRVIIAYRQPWIIPADTTDQQLETYRKEVEDTLNAMKMDVDRVCHYSDIKHNQSKPNNYKS